MTSVTWADPLSPVTARVGTASEIGNYRESNQDLFALEPEHPFAVVLNGMGGQEFGAESARVGAEVVSRVLAAGLTAGGNPTDILTRFIREGHSAVLDLQMAPDGRGCGASVVTALLRGGRAFVTWAGSSMAFRVSGDKVERLTWMHDFRTIYCRQNGISAAEAANYFWKNVLVHYLGCELPDPIEVPSFAPRPGDRLVLATDGAWGPVGYKAPCMATFTNDTSCAEAEALAATATDEALAAACRSHPDPLACAEHLVKLAIDNGSRDNATCVVMAFDGEPHPDPPAAPRRWWRPFG